MIKDQINILQKYRDANKVAATSDQFNKLFSQFSDGSGIKNMGGFRIRTSKTNGQPAFVLLITNASEPEWPDSLDIYNSTFLYYGDKRKPCRSADDELHKTNAAGNKLLRDAFFNLENGQREQIPPFLVFRKQRTQDGVYNQFLGLAAPGFQNHAPLSSLKAVWHRNEKQQFCLNYAALFTILNSRTVAIQWLDEIIQTGSIIKSEHCPDAWAAWVKSGAYSRLPYDDLLFEAGNQRR